MGAIFVRYIPFPTGTHVLSHFTDRLTQGLRISKYYGNLHERSPTDIEVGVCDADKAFSACIEHTRSLDEREYVFLQCAVLHTTRHGQRRVRTCNLALQVTSLAKNVFRFADMDAVVCHLARECECSVLLMELSTLTGLLQQ